MKNIYLFIFKVVCQIVYVSGLKLEKRLVFTSH